jgi:hypothetical protein
MIGMCELTHNFVRKGEQDRQYTYSVTLSRVREAISIKYSECVFVALITQRAMRMRHIANLWPAPLYHIFPHYLIKGTIFEKKNRIQNVCFDSLYNFCVKHLSFQEELSEM